MNSFKPGDHPIRSTRRTVRKATGRPDRIRKRVFVSRLMLMTQLPDGVDAERQT